MHNILTSLLTATYPEGQKGVELDGIKRLEFVLGGTFGKISSMLAEYDSFSWQVKFSVGIVVLGTIAVGVMLICQYFRIRRGHKMHRSERDYYERFGDAFRYILESRELLSEAEINNICEMTDKDKGWNKLSAYILARVITQIRLEMMPKCDYDDAGKSTPQEKELLYLPNISMLCKVTGVTALYEEQLEKRRDVISTLQDLLTLTLPVTEGYLARYTTHRNKDIKYMARMCHVFCTKAEPYKYIGEDLKSSQPLWYPMMLHRLFGWLKQTNHQMPKFALMATETKNIDSAAFLIKEIGFWGDENEKARVNDFLQSPIHKCVEAALEVIGVKGNFGAEGAIMEAYANQPEHIRRECLRAIGRIASGENADFFVKAFEETSSMETRTCALECLYAYGRSGLQRFIDLSNKYAGNESMSDLIHELESIELAKQTGYIL